MTRSVEPENRRFMMAAGVFFFWTLVFAAAYTQWPLYSENQNTKFLHGLAWTGEGTLSEDWLANTLDPLPAFSLLVYGTKRFLHQSLFYVYQALFLGLYLFSLVGIADEVFALRKTRVGIAVFSIFVVALHASLAPPFSAELLGTSLGWLLQAGVANQYLFNPVFQPASFGVLLILSIYLFLRGHPFWATASVATAAVFHSTYLPSAATLTVVYMAMTWLEGTSLGPQAWRRGASDDERTPGSISSRIGGWVGARRALMMGLLALAIVLPVLLYNAVVLSPTSADLWARAQEIIVVDRIPHHSLPSVWVDNTVYAKIGIVVLGMIMVRRSRLLPILLFPALLALVFTWVQMRTGSDFLAFIAPWRMSVFLAPLSTAMLAAWAIAGLCNRFTAQVNRYQNPILVVAGLILLFVVFSGLQATRNSFSARRSDGSQAMTEFVRSSRQPGTVYLTPVHMANFRLETSTPVVITWKSHPYKDIEVIEWKDRVDAVNAFYGEPHCGRAVEMAERYDVTHILFQGESPLTTCAEWTKIYQDDAFSIMAWTDPS